MYQLDVDQYYTPTTVAAEMLEAANLPRQSLKVCVDTACGRGTLLSAAEQISAQAVCIGLDRDPRAVKYVRSVRPNWRVGVGDALEEGWFRRMRLSDVPSHGGLAVLNPPFSLGQSKGLIFKHNNGELFTSVAMAHLLRAIELFQPEYGAVAIVPESLLFSDTDGKARHLLEQSYEMKIVRGLKSTTFKGTRANALIVRLSPKEASCITVTPSALASVASTQRWSLIRGGLPVFQATRHRRGIPFVHTTDLASAPETSHKSRHCDRVKPFTRGVVSGNVILLPRVGLPSLGQLRAIRIDGAIQLSDCVFAIKFASAREAQQAVRGLRDNWWSLANEYKGTGARYITVDRLSDWLTRHV